MKKNYNPGKTHMALIVVISLYLQSCGSLSNPPIITSEAKEGYVIPIQELTHQPNLMPTGSIVAFGGSVVPSGWLLCDGKEISRFGQYINLFRVIGTAYGTGNNINTFNLPDLRGRTLIGAGQGNGLTPRSLGQAVGEENHQLTPEEMPPHSHSMQGQLQNGTGVWDNESIFVNQSMPSHSFCKRTSQNATDTVGGGSSHNNMQPSLVANYIIKY